MNLLNNKLGGSIPLGFVVATTLTLFGCGGEGNEGSAGSSVSASPNTQRATLSAQNATYSTGYAESFEVDLSSKVFSSTGGGFVLSEVEVLSNDDSCQVESMTETGFVIQASDTKVCDYQYHATPKTLAPMSRMAEAPMAMSDNSSSEGSSSAVTRIAVSSDPSSTELVPVSATTLINEGVSVSLKAELDKVGFTLGDEFVLTDLTLPYARSSSAQINDIDDQVLEYTPPAGFTGIDRILYTLEDSANGLVLMGVLDIAVGYEANQGFSIQDNAEYADVIEVNTLTEINIDDFVTSDDGDDYQLVYVESFDATAKAKDPLDLSNKLIEFKASKPGYYYVSFGVSDHNGTYDMGLIKVRVFDPNLLANWPDIYYGTYKYTAPITVAQAENDLVQYDGAFLDDNGFLMSSFYANNDVAEAAVTYCGKLGGVVPTAQQLEALGRDKLALDYYWPVSVKYMARNIGASVYLYATDLIDGESNRVYGSNLYVTCAIDNIINIDVADSDFEAIANATDKAKISVRIAANNIPTVGALVSISTDSDYVSIDDPDGETDENGNVKFFLDSVRSEIVNVTVDYDGRTITQEVEFIGDANTAAITLDASESILSAVDVGNVTAKLKDAFNNDLPGERIDFTVRNDAQITDSNIIEYDSAVNEFNAHASVSLIAPTIGAGGIADYTPYIVTASYTKPSGDIVKGEEEVKFATAIGSGFQLASSATGNCLTDGIIDIEAIDKTCLDYDTSASDFGFTKDDTYIVFDGKDDTPIGFTAYGYWRQTLSPSVSSTDSDHALGYWQLNGCNDDTCGDFDILVDRFGLSFGDFGRVAISASKGYGRYKLIFIEGPVDRSGAIGRRTFSEITMEYAP